MKNMPKLVELTQKKTVVMGFQMAIRFVISLSQELLSEGYLQESCARFVNQDPLEHYFGLIHARLGRGCNPDVIQFKYVLRTLLAMKNPTLISSEYENTNITCQDSIVDNSSTDTDSEEEVEIEIELTNGNETETGTEFEITLGKGICDTLDKNVYPNAVNQILCYLAGYIVHCLVPYIKCPQCKISLVSSPEDIPAEN